PSYSLCFSSRVSFLLSSPCPFSFFLITQPPPTSTLFPYTTLFRSMPVSKLFVTQPFNQSNHYQTSTSNQSKFACTTLASPMPILDRKSTRLNSSHVKISYAVFCLKKKNIYKQLCTTIK